MFANQVYQKLKMRINSLKQQLVRIKRNLVLLLFSCLVFIYCKQEPEIWKPTSKQQVAVDYITSYPEKFSEFVKLMESTGMSPVLGVRGPYTLFVPTNDAMFAYYALKNVKSLDDFTDDFKEMLIRNHIITNELSTADFGLGAIRDTNAIGNYLVTEFQGSDIIVNKNAKIIKRDIRVANGLVNIVDKVLDPVTDDIYTVVASNPSYKIFAEGLSLTGLKDTLQVIRFPYGKRMSRTHFTLFGVADTIYYRYGIYNVADLIKWCGANPDSVTFLENPFYRYMEYHCLQGTHYLSDFNTKLYPILSFDNNIAMRIDADYMINFDRATNKYTGFNITESNVPAKNGALHSVTDLLPVVTPPPSRIIFETTDFFDLKQGDYYQKYYMRWSDGENTFAKIHWVGDFMQYYYKPITPENLNHDALNMLGWWTISVTFPKVMKGKYKISVFQPAGWDVATAEVYLDGERTKYTYMGSGGTPNGGLQQVADGDFATTAEHTITLKNLRHGGLWWDYVQFDPAD